MYSKVSTATPCFKNKAVKVEVPPSEKTVTVAPCGLVALGSPFLRHSGLSLVLCSNPYQLSCPSSSVGSIDCRVSWVQIPLRATLLLLFFENKELSWVWLTYLPCLLTTMLLRHAHTLHTLMYSVICV